VVYCVFALARRGAVSGSAALIFTPTELDVPSGVLRLGIFLGSLSRPIVFPSIIA
jgi:hypothetical protein